MSLSDAEFWVPDCAAATNILSKPLLGRALVPMRSRKVRIAIRGRQARLAPTPTIGLATLLQVHQALDPKAARQSTLDRRFDEGGAK